MQERIAELEAQRAQDQALIENLRAAEQEHRAKVAGLEYALTGSRQIGTAIGIVMSRYRVTNDHAFDLLRWVSQNGHRKLREVADDVILTADLPSPLSGAVTAPNSGARGRHGETESGVRTTPRTPRCRSVFPAG
jgi:vacuolar-type H+-ATPase subunit I/STV1